MKKIFLFLTLVFLPISFTFGATKTWDLNNPTDYELSNSSKVEVADGVAKLKEFDGGYYPTERAYVTAKNSLNFNTKLTAFYQKLGQNTEIDVAGYFVSTDNGNSWKCFESGAWEDESSGICNPDGTKANDIDAHIESLDTDGGQFKWKAVLVSDDNGEKQVELDEVIVDYESSVPTPSSNPTDISLSKNSIQEGNQIGDEVGILSTTDPDSTIFTYELTDDTNFPDNLKFKISGTKLLTNDVFNYNTKHLYHIKIKTTDESGNSFKKEFDISITKEQSQSQQWTQHHSKPHRCHDPHALNYKEGGKNDPSKCIYSFSGLQHLNNNNKIASAANDILNRNARVFRNRVIEMPENQIEVAYIGVERLQSNIPVLNAEDIDNVGFDLSTIQYELTNDYPLDYDNNLFEYDKNTGLLRFKLAPDFENPNNAQKEEVAPNLYKIEIKVSNKSFIHPIISRQTIFVKIKDVPELGNNCSFFDKDITKFGNNPKVKELQKFLNQNGFKLANSGAGSIGNETNYFGYKTRNAMKKFQDKYKTEIFEENTIFINANFDGWLAGETRKQLNKVYCQAKKVQIQFMDKRRSVMIF